MGEKLLVISIMVCILLSGCGHGGNAKETDTQNESVTSSDVEQTDDASTGTLEIDESMEIETTDSFSEEVVETNPETVNAAGMPVKEYLSTYGVEQYQSDYLELTAVPGVTYVPTQYGIDLYYLGQYCGNIHIMNMRQPEWTTDISYIQGVLGGAATLYEQMENVDVENYPGLVMICRRDDELYGQPAAIEWLLEQKKIQTSEEAYSLSTCFYEIMFGEKGQKYGYRMCLSTYFLDELKLKELLTAVKVKENGCSEIAYQEMQNPGNPAGKPDTVLSHSDLRSVDNAEGKDFRFTIEVNGTETPVPEGTVAVETDGRWVLYAYVQWELSRIAPVD